MNSLTKSELKDFLDYKVNQFNNPAFIELDPIRIPHQFSLKEDIETARQNDFGRKLFESFASEYANSYLNEKSETASTKRIGLINHSGSDPVPPGEPNKTASGPPPGISKPGSDKKRLG